MTRLEEVYEIVRQMCVHAPPSIDYEAGHVHAQGFVAAVLANAIDQEKAEAERGLDVQLLREAFGAGARYGAWHNSLLKSSGIPFPAPPNFETWIYTEAADVRRKIEAGK